MLEWGLRHEFTILLCTCICNKNILEYVEIVETEPKSMIQDNEGRSNSYPVRGVTKEVLHRVIAPEIWWI